MTTVEVLEVLSGAGVTVWADSDGLHYTAVTGLTPELRCVLVEHKASLLAYLGAQKRPCVMCEKDVGPGSLWCARCWLARLEHAAACTHRTIWYDATTATPRCGSCGQPRPGVKATLLRPAGQNVNDSRE